MNQMIRFQNSSKLFIILVCLLLTAAFLLTSCITINPAPTPTPTPTVIPTPTSGFPIMDSFNLAPYDGEALKHMTIEASPFNRYGFYLSPKFFVEAGEVLDIKIESNAPITFENWSNIDWRISDVLPKFRGGLIVSLWLCKTIGSNYGTTEFEELERLDENWGIHVIWHTDMSGFYQLCMDNDSGKQALCTYAISLR